MAEILTLGISHYPPLGGSDENMSSILKHMLQNPHLPSKLKNSDGWPEGMQKEWGNDEGTQSARRHREELVAEFRKVREAIDAFQPDFVLIWGDDQYENFKDDVIPPYCICAYDEFEFGPPKNNVWNEPDDKRFKLSGHRAAGKYLAHHLIRDEGFDTAYSYRPLHHPLGHAFTNAIFYLDYDRKGFPYPILPFAVNCYGRRVISQRGGRPIFGRTLGEADLDPSAPTPERLFDLGAATARVLLNSPWRVALLASSGWSHAFLTEKTNYLWPDTDADVELYNALRNRNFDFWRNYSSEAIEESGQQEVLNWMCLTGAIHELDQNIKNSALLETWIFNSSKCFVIGDAV